MISVKFLQTDCRVCPARSLCTQAETQPRELTFRPRGEHEALQAARQQQTTAERQKRYQTRAGIEETLPQGVRAFELRRTRYWGLAKTHLQHLLTAEAINLGRPYAWLTGVPLAQTRTSRFAALAPT